GPARDELQSAGTLVGGQIHAHRGHVAFDLARGFLEGKVKRALTSLASRRDKPRCQRAFAAAGGTCQEDTAAAVKSFAAQHRVESGYARRRAPGRGFMRKTQV